MKRAKKGCQKSISDFQNSSLLRDILHILNVSKNESRLNMKSKRRRNLLRDKIVTLEKSIKDVDAETLKKTFGNLKGSELMRSIIMNEKQYCTCTHPRSQRNFWYSVVKPCLDKLGKLSPQDDTEDALTGWDKKLSKYLSEMVSEGKLTYQDIMIFDESRNYNVPVYSFSPYSNIIVACEKDTIYSIVEDISRLLGCSCISSKGLCSLGAMEQLIRKIQLSKDEPLTEIILLILSDYDPTGYNIADTLAEHAKTILRVLGSECVVKSKRIGIVPEQLTEDEIKNNMYTPKRKGIEKWMELTGGIDGQEKGLELDALDQDRTREIFASALQPYIDSSEYFEYGKSTYLISKIREEIEKYTDGIVKQVYTEMQDKVNASDFNMLDYVRLGLTSMPVNEIYSVSGVEDCVRKYFE